ARSLIPQPLRSPHCACSRQNALGGTVPRPPFSFAGAAFLLARLTRWRYPFAGAAFSLALPSRWRSLFAGATPLLAHLSRWRCLFAGAALSLALPFGWRGPLLAQPCCWRSLFAGAALCWRSLVAGATFLGGTAFPPGPPSCSLALAFVLCHCHCPWDRARTFQQYILPCSCCYLLLIVHSLLRLHLYSTIILVVVANDYHEI
ncbi:hypothetical protein C8R45DRAFT_1180558, partial [Mycena sanguinolenta]